MIRDYFKEQTEYEQIKSEMEGELNAKETQDFKNELNDILSDVDLPYFLYEYDVINNLQYHILKESFDLEVNLKEKTK